VTTDRCFDEKYRRQPRGWLLRKSMKVASYHCPPLLAACCLLCRSAGPAPISRVGMMSSKFCRISPVLCRIDFPGRRLHNNSPFHVDSKSSLDDCHVDFNSTRGSTYRRRYAVLYFFEETTVVSRRFKFVLLEFTSIQIRPLLEFTSISIHAVWKSLRFVSGKKYGTTATVLVVRTPRPFLLARRTQHRTVIKNVLSIIFGAFLLH